MLGKRAAGGILLTRAGGGGRDQGGRYGGGGSGRRRMRPPSMGIMVKLFFAMVVCKVLRVDLMLLLSFELVVAIRLTSLSFTPPPVLQHHLPAPVEHHVFRMVAVTVVMDLGLHLRGVQPAFQGQLENLPR